MTDVTITKEGKAKAQQIEFETLDAAVGYLSGRMMAGALYGVTTIIIKDKD